MNILIFGGTGTLGTSVAELAEGAGHAVTSTSRTPDFGVLEAANVKFDSVIWAQGQNVNDTVASADRFNEILDANVGFIARNLRLLMEQNLLASQCRLVIISSVWEELSRENKFSYSVSKAALVGLVNSITADFAKMGIICNAVRPGVVDTPMTSGMLNADQIAKIIRQTPTRSLVTSQEVAKVILWLASPDSSGVAGQIFSIDNGWSKIRDI
ncbi:MAG: SDR family oxidoreductase [Actinobacteria bacterium]|nr:SDR family oxidoreductase [Actinomycetota bacterium]